MRWFSRERCILGQVKISRGVQKKKKKAKEKIALLRNVLLNGRDHFQKGSSLIICNYEETWLEIRKRGHNFLRNNSKISVHTNCDRCSMLPYFFFLNTGAWNINFKASRVYNLRLYISDAYNFSFLLVCEYFLLWNFSLKKKRPKWHSA